MLFQPDRLETSHRFTSQYRIIRTSWPLGLWVFCVVLWAFFWFVVCFCGGGCCFSLWRTADFSLTSLFLTMIILFCVL